MSTSHLVLHNVSKTYQENKQIVPAVHSISLSVAAGQFVAVIGPSGCGKTTTLRLLAGFETPDEGDIEIAGRQVNGRHIFVSPEKRDLF